MHQKLLLAGLVVLLSACGTEQEPQQQPPPVEQDPGLVKDSSGNTVEYPKGPFGTGVGDVVKNFRLLGYKDGDSNGSYRYISLSDYYNSDGSGPGRILWVNASAEWCVPCNQEAPEMVRICAAKASAGLRCYTSMTEDHAFKPAYEEVLKRWDAKHKLDHTLTVDPDTKWGYYFDAAAVPMNMLIDLRTMKILYVTTGFSAQALEEAIDAALKQ